MSSSCVFERSSGERTKKHIGEVQGTGNPDVCIPILTASAELTQLCRRLVCSDLISRGIDISHVSHVVSYDVPIDICKYVHRVGRTARAGRAGDAWTLVEEQEVSTLHSINPCPITKLQARYFKGILRDADHLDRVKRIRVGRKDLAPLLPAYEVRIYF